MTNVGVGLGMVAGVGGAVGSSVGGIVQNTMGSMLSPAQQPAAAALVCPKCGKPLPARAKFCLECGEQIGEPATNTQEIVCPACGATVPPGKFCLECGNKL